MKQLAVHVLFAWPMDQVHGEPKQTLTFVEHGESDEAYLECRRAVHRFEGGDFPVRTETVRVPSTAPNPCGYAIAVARQQLDLRPADPDAPAVVRVSDEDALTVSVVQAEEYLLRVHCLGAVITDEDYSDVVLLRLARRAVLGDVAADLALAEIAAEHDRATATKSTDPLVYANSGEL